jgi:leucyl aminopeptidase (aminopeptidase T)
MNRELAKAAEAAMWCLGVTADDDVVVLSNPARRTIADALIHAATDRARSARLVEYPDLTRNGEEPPPVVRQAMLDASAVIAVTVYSISHTQARLAASSRGVRVATSRVGPDLFARTLPIDYAELRATGELVATAMSGATECRITSPAGTDVTLSIAGRRAVSDDGHLQEPGAFGNLPAGEAYIAPIETTGDGVIVFDGSLATHGLLHKPLRIKLQGGSAVAASGEAADWLLSTLDAGGEHGRSIAEIGIGTNPNAPLSGSTAVDEKVLGTAHLAFGTSASFGGRNVSSIHIDGVMLEPTVELDGQRLLDGGVLRPGS